MSSAVAIALVALAVACGATPIAMPDTGALPSCSSLGCSPVGDGLCTADNRCDCQMQACEGERGTFKHDAGIDQ